MDFKSLLDDKIKEAEKIIYSYLPEIKGKQAYLIEAMNYGVKVGGKRLRPIFILESLKLFNADEKDAYPFMAAMEFIHTYSLIHDDLPAMDNADLRRGKEAVHKKFGEAFGVLAGDALLNFAFELISGEMAKLNDANKILKYNKALNILAVKSGIYGMAGGQSVDVSEEGNPLDNETIDFIYSLKTGALIEASMMIGATLGGAGDSLLTKIQNIASDIGMAFQIQDDILDITSSENELGKPVNVDDVNNKYTFVTNNGLEKSKEIVKMLSDRAIDNLNELYKTENIKKNEFLESLIFALIKRKY